LEHHSSEESGLSLVKELETSDGLDPIIILEQIALFQGFKSYLEPIALKFMESDHWSTPKKNCFLVMLMCPKKELYGMDNSTPNATIISSLMNECKATLDRDCVTLETFQICKELFDSKQSKRYEETKSNHNAILLIIYKLHMILLKSLGFNISNVLT
jgi:hypothetical protein